MSDIGTLAALTGVLALSVVSPGPNFVLVTSTALRASRRAGLAVAAGLALASLSWVVLTEVGFTLLLAPGTIAATIARVIGAAYLIVIGIRMVIGARRPLPQGPVAEAQGAWASLRKGYVVSMTSPKSLAFYASILGAMMPTRVPMWFDASVVAIAFSVSLLWYGALALAFSGDRVRRGFARVKTGLEKSWARASSRSEVGCSSRAESEYDRKGRSAVRRRATYPENAALRYGAADHGHPRHRR